MTTLETPGPTVGVVGGGQLGRMLGEAAAPLGIEVIVLDPTPECPAAPVVSDQLVAGFDDEEAIRDLASRVDVLTFEIELADQDVLERVEAETGTPVHPKPATLRTIHDKLVQKRELEDAGIPVPPFREVEDAADIREAIDDYGAPVMLKARTGGYDGRGNVPVESKDEAAEALESVAGPAMVEAFVEFEREVSVIAVKGEDDVATFPLGENVHVDEVLRETIVPARSSADATERAYEVARDVLEVMDGRGVYGIELFETSESARADGDSGENRAGGGEILLNEIAPRPHNSGHWTIEGTHHSQFEQHLRAVLGWPLGETQLRSPTVLTNLLADVEDERTAQLRDIDSVLETPDAHLHWYGKEQARPLRKMGHVTVSGREEDADIEALLETARDLEDGLTFRPE
ncbi:5-(carboxyamino)imidazole ribonucleotide synthase [Natronorubrum daqingense]|uniref:N5-carboxyaminoimidazole ribonucleotide synthase n=1 Tax=Natronorubrum daqingense TaxID=588898 RepID=A0A1N6YHQ9_9EURY|nr:5-(carboxyamino)imidazole ribonucleotide synthase [Natronorubrum daqingense]APX95663.1 5-(carboxyamino)imidazole ribonucleotide synthase [Natronorubrum daqingense]SIR14097.1 5-(carboxyamino)imidazole ribonucleotide synthase [Natronorubrum daqingense]